MLSGRETTVRETTGRCFLTRHLIFYMELLAPTKSKHYTTSKGLVGESLYFPSPDSLLLITPAHRQSTSLSALSKSEGRILSSKATEFQPFLGSTMGILVSRHLLPIRKYSGGYYPANNSSIAHSAVPRDTVDAAGWPVTTSGSYIYTVYHGGAWIGMFVLACFLLVIYALLAGLTLAICGLDMTWLQMRSITGTAKERYVALSCSRILKHRPNNSTDNKLVWWPG